eukprot:TRINITY_DN5800_c0_g1_i1.p1 TRINITY_DN5800_c0_g1~~TRINITY_DN5800_c0_g1_i1.p1  ORF type:complete len:393 (+),score=44.66 TRINITY_DN5800_c0_g1_i1:199-1377(+)
MESESDTSLFLFLPFDVLLKVSSYLTPQEVCILSSSCKALNDVLLDDYLWLSIFKDKWSLFPRMIQIAKRNNGGLTSSSSTARGRWKKTFLHTKGWDMSTFSCQWIGAHPMGVTSLYINNDLLFSGSHDTTIHAFKMNNLNPPNITPEFVLHGHKYTIWALTGNEQFLFSGSNDHTIRVWDLKEKTCLSVLTEHNTKIFSLQIKDKVLFSTGDSKIKIWKEREKDNPGSLSVVHSLEGHTQSVNTTSIAGDLLFSGSSDKSCKLWDLHTLGCVRTITDPSSSKILSLTVGGTNPNLIFTGSQDCRIKVFDIREGKCVKDIRAHSWDVWQLSLGGGFLFSGSFDHTIKSWDVRTFTCVNTLKGHKSYIHALSTGDDVLLSGSADKTIRKWCSI